MSLKDENSALSLLNDDDLMNSVKQSINSVDFKTDMKTDNEFNQLLERSMIRTPGIWKSKGSEKEIEENIPIPTREKITYKWKLPPGRLKANAEFEDSSSKLIKNQYVKLEPRSKEVFESSDILITDSCVQTIEDMVDKEMQTVLGFKDNKCFQSVTVDEEMFQFQPLTDSNKALDDFLKKHVPNLVKQLKHNQLYDLYRDDYKLLEINIVEDDKSFVINNEVQLKPYMTTIKLIPTTYQNPLSPKRYVSSHSWHPTIPGIFALSYTTNNIVLNKFVSIDTSEEITKSTDIGEKHGISYSDDKNIPESWNNQLDPKLSDRTYKEKIMFLLNKEFVQRMRLIQVIEDEKMNEKQSQHQINQLDIHDSLDSNDSHNDVHERSYEDLSQEDETFIDEAQNEQMEINSIIKKDHFFFKHDVASIGTYEEEDKGNVDHHDSDTESFYNIWGDDEEWIYGNKLRNVVRNMHRKFNRRYDREASEKKLLKLLESETENTKNKNKSEDMAKKRMKLTKDLFEAGDTCKKNKSRSEMKSINISESKKQFKVLENFEDSIIKRENTQIIDEQSNSVIIWAINDHIFPKLRLESPEEVCCIEFSPVDGNIVVGGLKNGQMCIWDITGKLEAFDLNESSMSEKEKKHQEHLSMHMQWSLNTKYKTRIRPTAVTAILESHNSMVTGIQWIHPMSQITHLGQLVRMPEGKLSMQFFSSSMDGTLKVWDLQLPLFSWSNQTNTTSTRFKQPKNLNDYKSPFDVYNNRLTPIYTIVVKQLDDSLYSHITAMSFEISPMKYKSITDQPMVIGKRHYEYVPTEPISLNRTIVVGNIMGYFGVMTWNGYDKNQENGNIEECKHVWGKHMHDGPIICIKINVFYSDIHLVCGGYVASIWSLKHRSDPIWFKRFDDFINSATWSTLRPLEFRLCFNKSGVIQFWNLMESTNQPYYSTDIVLGDNLLTLSAPRSPLRFLEPDKIKFAKGVHEVLNFKKNELISFSNHAGTIKMITINLPITEVHEIEKIRQVIQKEIDRRIELDAWNEKYTEEFYTIKENIADHYINKSSMLTVDTSVHDEDDQQNMAQKELERRIRTETYQWYINRRGPYTRLGKMKEKYLEREKQYMIDTMMKKMEINEKQIEEHFKKLNENPYDEDYIKKLRSMANEKYKIEKLIQSKKQIEFKIITDSVVNSSLMKNKIHQLLGTDFESEKIKLNEFIKNNTYMETDQDWYTKIESAVLLGATISYLLRNPSMMRRQLQNMNNTFEEDEEGLFE